MYDQAESLRRMMDAPNAEAKVIAVVSGKGGVGKSNISLNFAISLAKKGQRVAIIDLDIGMANVDILMGLSPRYHIMNLLDSELSIWDIIEQGPEGIAYIGGGSGFSKFVELDDRKMERFFSQFEIIGQHFDYIILDMGAGATKDSIQFILAADDVLVVTTPEPPAMTDAYAMVKYIYLNEGKMPLHIVVNRADSDKEGKRTLASFQRVASQFLQKELNPLGYIPADPIVQKAVKAQVPFVLYKKDAKASLAMDKLTALYLGETTKKAAGFSQLISRVKHLFKEKQG
ncbi:MinD/ParA family protein [Alkalihalobacillus oceani]|uniref:MinD/ParA family protein n=1 Tax=Halalkalibacter oceani TaxID=1653776 RepID=UPI00203BF6DF|nr:MinD/ParA family protein [Halalkalibacter oceani]MCM3759467.1 MinD/ParA family protein [Halalkalibacter oceani]